jgi:hypothetical protein
MRWIGLAIIVKSWLIWKDFKDSDDECVKGKYNYLKLFKGCFKMSKEGVNSLNEKLFENLEGERMCQTFYLMS